MGKQSQPKEQTVTQVTKLPAYIEEGGKNNLNFANQVAGNLKPGYKGPMIADMNGDQQAAFQAVRNGAFSAQPGLQSAASTLQRIQNYTAKPVTAGAFTDANVGAYMSPYDQQVIDAAQNQSNVALKSSLNAIRDSSIASGAFGGTRQFVQEGVAAADAANNMASLTANLKNTSYNNAMQQINADQNRALTADTTNQSAAKDAAQLNALSASQLTNTSQAIQSSNIQGSGALQTIGDSQRQYEQDKLAWNKAMYDDDRTLDIQRLNIRSAALSATPYGETKTTTGPAQQQGSSPLLQGLGALGTIPSILSSFMMLSDEKDKKNKKLLGRDPESGLPIYSYDYKGDPAGTPKRVGPMAQDIEKMFPGSTKEIGGHRVVTGAPAAAMVSARPLNLPPPKRGKRKKGMSL